MNVQQKSMLELTISLMSKKKKPQKISDLIRETISLSGFDDSDGTLATSLYLAITTSGLFVFCGEGTWDLKTRQDISLYDKDGSYFTKGVVEEDEVSEVTAEDYEVVDDEETAYEVIEHDDEDSDDLTPTSDNDDGDLDSNYIQYPTEYDAEADNEYDEDEYNDYMDDYEELYEDN